MKLGVADLLSLVGAGTAAYGAFGIAPPVGFLVTGLLVLWFAVSLARWEARKERK